ncbi:MAG: hypothetical protein JW808_10380, partial [Victivallales bacterium]|nr:hypothetical protein [Victivallales bacterium]
LFAKILRALSEDSTIGMAGAACAIPPHANPFQQRAMRQIPRRHFPVQPSHLDSDMVQHPCMAMPRDLFLAIGGEDEQIIRGLDPVLRKKVRDAGRRVVIVADTYVYHLLPGKLSKLLKMYFRNGRGSAFAAHHHPEKVLELTDGLDGGNFTEHRSLPYRAMRRACNLVKAIAKAEYIRLLVDCAYIAGYLCERLLGSYPASTTVAAITTETEEHNGCAIHRHRVTLA